MTSLVIKTGLAGSLAFAAILGIGTIYLTTTIKSSFQEQSENLQSQILSTETNALRVQLAMAARTAENIASTMATLRASGTKDRAVFDATLRDVLRASSALLGVWCGWEPGALDGRDAEFSGNPSSDATGRFLPYWNRSTGDIQRAVLSSYEDEVIGEYYLSPKKLKRTVAAEPATFPINGKDAITTSIGAPIEVNGKVVGVAGVDVDLSALSAALSSVKPFGTGYVALTSVRGVTVSHPNIAAVGKPLAKFDPTAAAVGQQAIETGTSRTLVAAGPDGQAWHFMASPIQAGETADRWAMVVAVPMTTLSAAGDHARTALFIISGLCILASCGALALLIRHLVGSPTRALAGTIDDMASGSYDADIPEALRRDEIGLVGQSVVRLRDSLRQIAGTDAAQRTAAHDAMDLQRKAALREMANGFEATAGKIVNIVASAAADLHTTARSMSEAAAQTANQSTAVAAAADQAAMNVNTVAAAAEQLGSSVQEISRQVHGSAELAQDAVSEAAQTATLVQDLSIAVARIGDVVTMISTIAGQTNLLALNATIEAARAGNAGRGFAVVATEVKELANQTSRATEQISHQITSVQSSTVHAVTAIEGIQTRIKQLSGVAATIASTVEEQGAATQEIARNVGQAAAGTGEVTNSIAGVASAAEETGTAAVQMLHSASELSRQSDNLTSEVSRFLTMVRAA